MSLKSTTITCTGPIHNGHLQAAMYILYVVHLVYSGRTFFIQEKVCACKQNCHIVKSNAAIQPCVTMDMMQYRSQPTALGPETGRWLCGVEICKWQHSTDYFTVDLQYPTSQVLTSIHWMRNICTHNLKIRHTCSIHTVYTTLYKPSVIY